VIEFGERLMMQLCRLRVIDPVLVWYLGLMLVWETGGLGPFVGGCQFLGLSPEQSLLVGLPSPAEEPEQNGSEREDRDCDRDADAGGGTARETA
jgi:hypothetical protein